MSLRSLVLAAALSLAALAPAWAADLSLTPASVVAGANASTDLGTAGETILAGQPLYRSSTTNKWMKADSNSATVEARTPSAIALNSASLNQPVKVQKGGDITIGGTLTANTPYFMSDAAGGICPIADVGSGEYLTEIGIAISATVLRLTFTSTGVAN